MAGRILMAALALTLTMATAEQAVAQVKGPVSPAHLEAEAKILKALSAKGEVEFLDTPLVDAMKFLADQWEVPVRIDEQALNLARLTTDEPVNLTAEGIPRHSLLSLALRQVELTWTIHRDAVLITTERNARNLMDPRVYDVTELLPWRSKTERQRGLARLVGLIQTTTSGRWLRINGTGGSVVDASTGEAESLEITQGLKVHQQIDRLLTELRATQHDTLPETDADPLPRPKQLPTVKSEQKLLRAMAKRVTVDFDNLALTDALQRLGEKTGTQILIDETSLAKELISSDEPVTFKSTRRSAGEVLSEVLKPLKCDWTILHDTVYVTTNIDAESTVTTRVYDVVDLVVIAMTTEMSWTSVWLTSTGLRK